MAGKIIFASDFHLGLNTGNDPLEREKKVVKWLNEVAPEASEIFLVGDIFDFWWEYRLVIPRGFTRFLGSISAITDSGIPVHFFTGNHDMWVNDYLSVECGMIIHTGPLIRTFDGKKFHIAHGEGLGSRNTGYKMLLWIFRNKPLRILYSALHPSIGVGIGHKWSRNSRLGKGISLDFLGEDKEDLIKYSKSILENESIDYFIYGHRHLALTYRLKEGSLVIYLGDWVRDGSFAEWNGTDLILKRVP
ncbi:MAG: UDP-2,3-diacylglucosamine diphosphatase [Bacteroidota bacterium]|nr:UDP-2,3-diacylglucosamine diphosphatase [Bacteroidota bacterium]